MLVLLSLAVFLVAYAANVWTYGQCMTPDGRIYTESAHRPRPYHLRWFLPWMVRESPRLWVTLSAVYLILTGPMLYVYLCAVGLEPWRALFGCILYAGLPGSFGLLVRYPVLVDQASNIVVLSSATFALTGHVYLAATAALLAGAIRETAPLWAAVLSMSPWPLIGLLAVAAAALLIRPCAPPNWLSRVVNNPFVSARQHHGGKALDAQTMLLPWGAVAPLALLAAVGHPWIGAALAAALGYVQLLVATDSARLYQSGAPAVIALGALACPLEFAPLVAVVHLLNPWAATVET